MTALHLHREETTRGSLEVEVHPKLSEVFPDGIFF